jgi:hypothetical protein
MSFIALSLGLDGHFFDDKLSNPLSTLRLLHYWPLVRPPYVPSPTSACTYAPSYSAPLHARATHVVDYAHDARSPTRPEHYMHHRHVR